MKKVLFLLAAALIFTSSEVPAKKIHAVNDEAIKEKIIQESIDSYPGPCACPYNSARNGSRCGKRSAYSRAGGYETICYKDDVTKQMIQDYKNRNKK
ncbi:hypothetical protein ACX1N5_11160 [Acinetobacter sp. ANC 4636]